MAILILEIVILKIKFTKQNKKKQNGTVKDKIYEENITIINLYVPNNTTAKYISQKSIRIKE